MKLKTKFIDLIAKIRKSHAGVTTRSQGFENKVAEPTGTLEELYEISVRQTEALVGINRAISGLTQAMTIDDTCSLLIESLSGELKIPRVILGLKNKDNTFRLLKAEGFPAATSVEEIGGCLHCGQAIQQVLKTGRRVRKVDFIGDDLACCSGLFADCSFWPLKGKMGVLGVVAVDDPGPDKGDTLGMFLNHAGAFLENAMLYQDMIKMSEDILIMNQTLKENNVELESAKSVAEKASLAKSEFLSSMSHELRSPLNAILGFTQLMESDSPPPSPSQQESIDQILKAGWHLLKLINEVLDLAKIESGKLSFSPEPLSMAEVMLECQGMVEPQAQQFGIKLTFPQFNIHYFVRADRTRVKQVLINLLSNAIKYNRARGTVVVDCFASAPERIRVSVKDTGKGLAPEQLAQLFQPFNRLGQETSAVGGTGIGLVIAKRLVELMGGVIGVESTVGVGSVFWFELISVAEPHISMEGVEPAVLAKTHAPREARLNTLLYVEDNPANLKLVEQIIARRPDLRLLTAVNGHLGIELARNSQPDAILMDINLPGINGFEALKTLREDPVTALIPVIAISANAMPLDIERGLKAGFFRYITKPIKVDEFMETLDVALEYAGQKVGQSK